ncbi:hypothetical protein D5086_025338 [Populus alba]|uniref:Uncharacterized protein n=1 Tax=Populus alba TaxID=43335 RepID=A0ACC4AYZ3_POPAL
MIATNLLDPGLGGGVVESTDGFATTTAASLVRVKDDSGVVKWKTATLTEPKAKKEEKGNDQNALKRPPITFFLLMLQGKVDPPKLNRCTELLSMQEELKQARKAFEVDEEKLASTE